MTALAILDDQDRQPLALVDKSEAGRLLDARGRALTDVRISLTDHCNLRCTYCMPQQTFGPGYAFLPKPQLLSFGEIAVLVRVLVGLGVRKVKLTGGEPLLRTGVPQLVRRLRETAPAAEINLITNGILLAPLAAELKSAGLDRLTISLDSLQPATFASISGRGAQLTSVLAGIEAAQRAGFAPLKVNMVVIRGVNDEEVESMAAFFRHTSIIVRFIEYMDVGTVNRWRRDQVVPSADILARLRQRYGLEPIGATHAGETAKRYRYSDGAGEIGFISSVTQPFCAQCTRLRLSADGKLHTCLFSRHGFDIKPLLRCNASAEAMGASIAGLWHARRDQYSVERVHAPARDKAEMFYLGG